MLTIHKPESEIDDLTIIRTSNEPYLPWKCHFYVNPIHFRIIADSEADKENDNSSIGNKTTNIYKQNPVLNIYYIISELSISKSGY